MQNQNKASLGLALATTALILSACGGDPQPEPPQLACTPPTVSGEQGGVICGTVTPWTAGLTGTVKPEELNVSTDVMADGRFGLPLPSASEMTTTYNADLFSVTDYFGGTANGICTLDAPPTGQTDVRLYGISKLMTDSSRQLAAFDPSKANYTAKLWMFADRDATFTFKGTCLGQGRIDQTFVLKKGWNVFDVEYLIPSGDSVKTVYTPATQPLDFTTQWRDTGSTMAQLSLKNNMLEPWKNSAAYKNRR